MYSRWLPCGVVWFLALAFAPSIYAAASADPAAELARAVQLFDQGSYGDAQQVLVALDRTKLNPDQQAKRDDYLNRVQVALTMQEKALRELEDAEVAAEEGERSKAVRLLESVIANQYAGEALRVAARKKLNELPPPSAPPPPSPPVVPAANPVTSPPPPPPPSAPPTNVQVVPAEVVATPTPPPPPPTVAPPVAVPAARPIEVVPVQTHQVGEVPAAAPMQARSASPQPVVVSSQPAANQVGVDARYITEVPAASPSSAPAAYTPPQPMSTSAPMATPPTSMTSTSSPARPGSLIDEMIRRDELNWQRAVAEYNDLEARIREHVSNERFEEANQLLVRAKQVVESARQFAEPISKHDALRQQYEDLADFVEEQERSYNVVSTEQKRLGSEQESRERMARDAEQRRRQVEALLEQAAQQRKDGDIEGAINTLKQIILIDPKFITARHMMDSFEDELLYRRERSIRDRMNRGQRAVLIDVEESKIPWYEVLNYPENWAELIAGPERNRGGRSKRDVLLLGALDKSIEVDFQRTPFHKVVEHLAHAHNVNILPNWHDLGRAGVKKDALIDLSLPNEISLKKALTEALLQATPSDEEIGFDVGDGAITIATKKFLDKHTYAAVYDIADLLMEIPNFTDAPATDLRNAEIKRPLPQSSQAAQRADQPWAFGDDDDDEAEEEDPAQVGRVDEIISLIKDTIDPTSWTDRGGSVGSIREFNGQLVVTQNSSAQRQIADMLGKLREQRAIQIFIEARYLTVASHYLEEFGVDLDVVLNNGNAGYDFVPGGSGAFVDPVTGTNLLLPRSFSRLGFSPATPAVGNPLVGDPNVGATPQPFGAPGLVPSRGSGGGGSRLTPVPFSNSITQLTDPSSLPSDIPGSFAGQTIAPALNVFGSFLDNIQVDFLIRATQADSRSTILTAPRLVLFNGQRSWVAVTIQQNFVSTLTPVVATGAAAQAPTVGTIDAGAVLDVQATVSADKRYVCMTVRPGVTRLLDLQTIPFGGGAFFNEGFIQFPTLSSQRLQTTVCVPDGGTLLIGGQKLASETEVEAGVPVLSKIPILKRLYNSRTTVKDEQTLLILIKPKIMIQSEQEEAALPTFAQGR